MNAEQRRAIRALTNVTVFESRFALEWMDHAWGDVVRAGHWLLELAANFKPDIVHLNGYVHAALPWRRPTLVVGHSCVLSWWEAVRGGSPGADWKCYRQLVEHGLRAADLVVAPTRWMLEALDRHYGPLPYGEVIPNGRDAGRFLPLEKEKLILTAGRLWDEAKNVATLAEAAADLPWPVHVAGERQHPKGGMAHFRNVGLLGPLPADRLAICLGHASIYAAPARYEPFGLSSLEAGLAGCALVLADIPSLREVWQDAATFVSPNDPAAWRVALRHLIEHPAKLAEAAIRARRRALTFTPHQMAEGYLSAYGEIMMPRIPNLWESTRLAA